MVCLPICTGCNELTFEGIWKIVFSNSSEAPEWESILLLPDLEVIVLRTFSELHTSFQAAFLHPLKKGGLSFPLVMPV